MKSTARYLVRKGFFYQQSCTCVQQRQKMLRAKYWFPGINLMMEQMIGNCNDCQVANKDCRQKYQTIGSPTRTMGTEFD